MWRLPGRLLELVELEIAENLGEGLNPRLPIVTYTMSGFLIGIIV